MELIILLEFYPWLHGKEKQRSSSRDCSFQTPSARPWFRWPVANSSAALGMTTRSTNQFAIPARKARQAKIKETVQHFSLEMNLCFGTNEVEPLR